MFRFHGRSLGSIVAFMAVIFLLLNSLCIAGIVTLQYRRQLQNATADRLVAIGEAKKAELVELVNAMADEGLFVAQLHVVREGMANLAGVGYDLRSYTWQSLREDVLQTLNQTKESLGYSTVAVVAPDGRIAATTDLGKEGTDLSGRPYVKSALAGQPSLSGIFYSDVVGRYCVAYAAPVKDGNDVLGAVLLVKAADQLEQVAESSVSVLGKGARAYLAGTDGTLYTGKTGGKVSTEIRDALASGKSRVLNYIGQEGARVVGYITQVAMGPGNVGLIIEVPESEVFAGMYRTYASTLIVIVVAALAISVVTFFIILRLTNPLGEVAQAFEELASGAGDLTRRIEGRGALEIQRIAAGFNNFLETLRNLVFEIGGTAQELGTTSQELAATSEESTAIAGQVTQGTHQISRAAQDAAASASNAASSINDLASAVEALAQGVSRQSESVDMVHGALAELDQAIAEIREAVSLVQSVSAENEQVAGAGASTVRNLIGQIDMVAKRLQEAALGVERLGQASENIGNIAGVISDIADQTNLLALNATIEAARAGEHGRGFAVVADEVRKLAQRSLGEAKNIDGLVKEVTKAISQVVKLMNASQDEIARGTDLASSASQALSNLEKSVSGLRDTIGRLSGTFERFDAAVRRVKEATADITRVVEENISVNAEMAERASRVSGLVENIAAATEESSAATQELLASMHEMERASSEVARSAQHIAEMAEKLSAIVAQFKL